MRPTFMGFETATRGLMAGQKALDIVANNTSNIGVTGYTRQRVDLVSLSVNQRSSRYHQNSTAFAGQGVGTYGVSQIRDPFLDKRFREEYADVGYYNVTSSVLEDLSAALDEITPSTMSVALSNFQNTWAEMQKKNNEATNAANVLASATQVVSIFQQMSAKVDNIWNQQEYNLGIDINNVNSILQRIADLNDNISKQRFNSMEANNELYKPLELMDQRNVLLDQLSGYANISYKEDELGNVTVNMGGHEVVKGDTYKTLGWSVDTNDPAYKTVKVFFSDTGEAVNFDTGAIKANINMLNGRGVDARADSNESYEEGILYYKEKIDQFARTFVEAFNSAIEMEDGGFKQLFSYSPENQYSAANIRVATAWTNDATYLYSGIKDKVTEGDDSNTFAAKVAQLFEKDLDFGEFKGKMNDYIMYYSVTKLSNNKAYSDSRLETVNGISDNLLNQIQDVSGVSFEEEGIDMMMYKKAYDAVSRVFTTLDEMLDKLINSTGVVGR